MEYRPHRTGVLTVAVLASLAVLTACGKGGPGVKAGEVATTGETLVAAAAKEGQVVFYCSLTPASCEALAKGFEKEYRGVSVKVLRATSPDLSARYATEKKSAAETADVILHADVPFIQTALEEGLVMSFEDAGMLPADHPEKWLLDSEGIAGTPYIVDALGIGINTDLVKPQDRPKTWADLGDPKWKGKMNGPHKDGSGYATYYGTVDDHVDGFLESLSKQEIFPDPGGMVSLTESLAAGQYAIQSVASKAAIDNAKAKGAPVDIVFPEPGATGPAFAYTLNPEPGHPNAQKLFADYVLSEKAGQALHGANSAIAAPQVETEFELLHPNLEYYRPAKVEEVAKILNGGR
ncbi:ABC transporter substrate-binding protein [Streptomyces prasinus]|uniref:ABC transporter substrate-binding protein n=1 Tax=Streptomyces prasinus TaxID=67345 RepID=UPI0033ABBE5D